MYAETSQHLSGPLSPPCAQATLCQLESPANTPTCCISPSVAIGYALSPLDLIPNFIPVLGLVDDLLILPLLVWVALKLILQDVWERARERAHVEPIRLAESWAATAAVFLLWDVASLALVWVLCRKYGGGFVQTHMWVPLVAVGGALVATEAAWIMALWCREERRVEPALMDPLLPLPVDV